GWSGAATSPSSDSGFRFALIPRPQIFEPLGPGDSAPRSDTGVSPSLWWSGDGSLPAEGTKAAFALASFQEALGLAAKPLDLSAAMEGADAARLPSGGVAVAIVPGREEARATCCKLVGYLSDSEFRGSTAREEWVVAEWHFAVRWNGRL
ncbi:unnamed protein product, partial [Polarella glacialis]